jgi:hypothetical protein
MKNILLQFAVLGCALLLSISAGAQQKSVITSSDDDEITLVEPTRAGNLTLQPDTYVLQHHASRGEDFVRFMQVRNSQQLSLTRAYTGWYTDTELIKAGDIKCRVQPLAAKAHATTATVDTENGKPRIIQVTIRGKAAIYLF